MSRRLSALFGVLFLCLISAVSQAAVLGPINTKFTATYNGSPVAGGSLYTYETGTTTNLATYTDSTESAANANPIVLDTNGQCDLWLKRGEAYRLVLTDADGTTLDTVDGIYGTPVVTFNIMTSTPGYLAYFSGVSTVSGVSIISGASIFNVFGQGEKITGDKFASGVSFPTLGNISANTIISGASLITTHTSGTSLVSLGTYVYHSGSGSSIYGLPSIPTTGVSVPYVMFDCGPAGGGITVYNTGGQPFLGSGLSGTSYLALPPRNPFETATLFGVVDESGTSAFWKVKADSSWVAGN